MKRQDDGKEPIRQRLQEKSPDSSSIDPKKFQVGAINAENVNISSRDSRSKRENEENVATKIAVVFTAKQSSRKTRTIKVTFKLDSGASDHLSGRRDVGDEEFRNNHRL